MRITELEGVAIIELAGRINVESSPELEKLCSYLLDHGQTKIICDFSNNEYVSSMGLRVFLSTLKRSVRAGGNLVLCCLKPGIMEIFDMTGLTGLFTIFDSVEAAVAFFRSESPQTHLSNAGKASDENGAIIINRQPGDVTIAYSIMPKQGIMDEKA